MTPEGEATGAIATTAGKAIDALSGLGKYAAEVVGDAPKDLVGWAVGDRLKARRIMNMERLGLIAAPLLEGIERARLSEPSPSVMIPLITAAADEERAELQDLWARLLANAAIDGGRKVRREFFETLKRMEPTDALMLEAFSMHSGISGMSEITTITIYVNSRVKVPLSSVEVQVCLEALRNLKCISRPSSNDIATAYGRSLMVALTVA